MTSQNAASEMETVLEGPGQYHSWFSDIKGSVPDDLWKYFDTETADEFSSPEPVTFSTVKQGAQSLQQLSTAEKTLFTQLRSLYNTDLTQYQRFLSEQAKLRRLIRRTVSEAKKSQLKPEKSVREWIQAIQASTKPTDAHMQDLVRARHRMMMGAKYQDWPIAGPDKWILDWQKLMGDCERWCPPFHQLWASDFNLVWGEVPGAQRLCDRLVEGISLNNLQDWSIFRVSMELKQAWDQRTIRSGMKVAGKGKITKAAFAVEPRFNGVGASEEKTDESSAEPSASAASSNSRKRAGTQSRQERSNKRIKQDSQQNERQPCWGCGGNHYPNTCVLIRDSNPRKFKIPDESKKIFQENMKDSDFAAQVRRIREVEEAKKEIYKRKNK
jgi:hypothetical protein